MNQRLQNTLLYVIPSLIWGSTWFVIKFQLGVVSPILSVAYRFALAGILLLIFGLLTKLPLKFSAKSHLMMMVQGICLFGVNYWLVYLAEQYLTSGLISVIFSLIIFGNLFLGALILKAKITREALVGGVIAFMGVLLIFKKELAVLFNGGDIYLALVYSLVSILLASLGNIVSAYNQKNKLPVLQTNAYGMLYGAVALFIVAIVIRTSFTFDFTKGYVYSLLYLSVFGSIVAFTLYLKLLGRIGPAKSSYVIVVIPLIAMLISTVFESYEWQRSALIGMPMLLFGNIMAMGMLRPVKKVKK